MARFEDLKVNKLRATTIYIGDGMGSATELSATELEYMDGVTAGTAAASKAVVLDSNGTALLPAPLRYDINTTITAFATGGQANATALTGEYNNVTTCATDGDSVKLPAALGGEVITVKNSGATSCAVFPATGDSINAMAVNLSVNLAPGATMTFFAISATVWETQEVLQLPSPSTQKGEFIIKATDNDGDTVTTLTNAAMAQASVISIPDPGAATANVMLTDQANDQALITATAAEINVLDGVTAGTVTASKALVADANADVNGLRYLTSIGNNGSAGTGCTAQEFGNGYIFNTRITINQTDAFTVADAAALADGHAIYTFPAGQILVLAGAIVDCAVTLAEDSANAAAEAGLGTLEGSGANATLGAVGAGAENIAGPIATAPMDGTAMSVLTSLAAPLAIADGDSHVVYFNIASTWNDTAGVDLTGDLTGVVHLVWAYMGNPA